MPRRPTDNEDLFKLFNPRAVAVLGMSADASKSHRNRLAYTQARTMFKGGVYPIGRNLREIDGAPCYASPADLPEQCDVVFMMIPAAATLNALKDCARAGIRVAIVGSSGFAESGDEGAKLQEELTRIVDRHGIRIVGPNCNGIYNATTGLTLGSNTAHSRRIPAGDIAIISHSGALFDMLAVQLTELGAGMSIFVSCGNEADFNILDYLEYALEQQDTNVVAMLVDAWPDGDRFRQLAARAHALNKYIVALKFGTTDKGAEAATAHSSRMASHGAAYAALFEAGGVAQVHTLDGLATAAALLSFYGRVSGGLAGFSASGAGAAVLADLAQRYGVPLAQDQQSTIAEIAPYRQFSKIGNPCDFGAFAGMANSPQVPTVIASDPGVGLVLAQMHALPFWRGKSRMDSLTRARAATGKPIIILAPGNLDPEQRAGYEQGGIRVFRSADGVLQGVAAMFTPPGDWPEAGAVPPMSPADQTLLSLNRPLTEPESLSLLARFGIATVETAVCASLDQAVAAAEKMGWPVVLKAVIPGLAHKSDSGMVRVDIRDATTLKRAYLDFSSPPHVAVQRYLPGKVEAIAGITRSRDVGTMLLAGLGGIYAESLNDVTMWAVPSSRDRIQAKLETSPLGRILTSTRWGNRESMGQFVDALLRLQNFALWAADRIEATDINPMVIGDAGVVAVDALVVPRRPAEVTRTQQTVSAVG